MFFSSAECSPYTETILYSGVQNNIGNLIFWHLRPCVPKKKEKSFLELSVGEYIMKENNYLYIFLGGWTILLKKCTLASFTIPYIFDG